MVEQVLPKEDRILSLKRTARWVRRQVLEMIVGASKGHIGGSLSCVDILVAIYHGGSFRFDPQNPQWEGRDRLIYSKGHAAEALYAVLASAGFISPDVLRTYGQNGSMLGGHVDRKIPGVEVSTGSLGHGLGIGAGLALAAKQDERDSLTSVILGDGECYEGSVWEAAMFAAHHRLDNLVAVIDRNRKITLDFTESCNRLEPFADKWRSFGWEVEEADGHRYEQLLPLFSGLRESARGRPVVVIADTIKGKGISFMEASLRWHHNVPKLEQVEIARKELGVHD
jgi:transketolase